MRALRQRNSFRAHLRGLRRSTLGPVVSGILAGSEPKILAGRLLCRPPAETPRPRLRPPRHRPALRRAHRAEPEPTIAEVAGAMRHGGDGLPADDAMLAQKLLEDEPRVMATEVLRRARGGVSAPVRFRRNLTNSALGALSTLLHRRFSPRPTSRSRRSWDDLGLESVRPRVIAVQSRDRQGKQLAFFRDDHTAKVFQPLRRGR